MINHKFKGAFIRLFKRSSKGMCLSAVTKRVMVCLLSACMVVAPFELYAFGNGGGSTSGSGGGASSTSGSAGSGESSTNSSAASSDESSGASKDSSTNSSNTNSSQSSAGSDATTAAIIVGVVLGVVVLIGGIASSVASSNGGLAQDELRQGDEALVYYLQNNSAELFEEVAAGHNGDYVRYYARLVGCSEDAPPLVSLLRPNIGTIFPAPDRVMVSLSSGISRSEALQIGRTTVALIEGDARWSVHCATENLLDSVVASAVH